MEDIEPLIRFLLILVFVFWGSMIAIDIHELSRYRHSRYKICRIARILVILSMIELAISMLANNQVAIFSSGVVVAISVIVYHYYKINGIFTFERIRRVIHAGKRKNPILSGRFDV